MHLDDIAFEDVVAEAGGAYPRIMRDGDMDAGVWSCGMVAGLIHDIPTVRELVDRTMAEAHELIAGRLGRLAARQPRRALRQGSRQACPQLFMYIKMLFMTWLICHT